MFPRRLVPGQKYTATEMEAMARRVYNGERVTGTGTVTLSRQNGTMIVRDNSRPPIHARITGSPTGAKYPWIEVARNAAGTGWDDIPDWPGRSGTAALAPAVELAGRTDVPTDSIVELSVMPGGTELGFSFGDAASINSQNVDGTALDATTDDIRADQATHIKFQTTGGYQRLYLDVTSLAGDETLINTLLENGALLTFTEVVDVVTCVDFVNATVKKTRITMLTGTIVDTARCVEAEECCPGVEVDCCPGVTIPQVLYVTISGGGGSWPASWDGSQWDTGIIDVPGCGTMRLQLACSGGEWGMSGTFDGLDCSVSVAFGGITETCEPFEIVVDGVVSGCDCDGAKTFTWTP